VKRCKDCNESKKDSDMLLWNGVRITDKHEREQYDQYLCEMCFDIRSYQMSKLAGDKENITYHGLHKARIKEER